VEMKPIASLIKKDLTIEWRQRYALNGILIYVFSAVFIVYLSAKMLNGPSWNAIFWLIMLFASVNAISKSFIVEGKGKNLYYHNIVKPQQMIAAKVIYNAVLNILLAIACLSVYVLLMGNPVQDLLFYSICVLLGSVGFSSTFTMLSAIASKANNSHLLMPVLSFPIIVPLLLVLVKACKKAMDGLDTSLLYEDIGVLMMINIMIVALAYILFPFLWKE
jgi:heme exporter protein B